MLRRGGGPVSAYATIRWAAAGWGAELIPRRNQFDALGDAGPSCIAENANSTTQPRPAWVGKRNLTRRGLGCVTPGDASPATPPLLNQLRTRNITTMPTTVRPAEISVEMSAPLPADRARSGVWFLQTRNRMRPTRGRTKPRNASGTLAPHAVWCSCSFAGLPSFGVARLRGLGVGCARRIAQQSPATPILRVP